MQCQLEYDGGVSFYWLVWGQMLLWWSKELLPFPTKIILPPASLSKASSITRWQNLAQS
jgi:hypothetical protein